MISTIDVLESRLGADWSSIRAARVRTAATLAQLDAAVGSLHDANYSIIVTGSLGRGEATEGSDADWLLLVDGPSDPEHAILARTIRSRIVEVIGKNVVAPARSATSWPAMSWSTTSPAHATRTKT